MIINTFLIGFNTRTICQSITIFVHNAKRVPSPSCFPVCLISSNKSPEVLLLQIDEGKLKKAHDELGYDTAEIRRKREEKVTIFLAFCSLFIVFPSA